jgi:hypothetical protein
MRASEYFDAFTQAGVVLFSKEVTSAWAKGECVEWRYLRLDKEFLEIPFLEHRNRILENRSGTHIHMVYE